MRASLCIAAVLLLTVMTIGCAALTAEECKEKGFLAEASCSHCHLLAEHTGDAELTAECKACCVDDDSSSDDDDKFIKARFEMDENWLEGSKWDKMVNEEAVEAFGGSRFKFVSSFRQSPRLVLTNADGAKTVIKVHVWEPHMVMDFLRNKLVKD